MSGGFFSSPLSGRPAVDVEGAIRRDRRSWWSAYGLCLAATLVMAVIASRTFPTPFSLALLLFLVVATVAVIRPVVAVYAVVFFAVLGDPLTAPWYPFVKNFSSHESMLFIADGITVYPLEVCLAALLFGWLLRMMATRRWILHKGRLFRPMMVFTGFMLFGFVRGLATGGDRTAAFWELRWVLVLPIVYLLLTNLFDRREQYVRLYALVMVAVFINSIIALINYRSLSAADKEGMESFVSHGATLSMNTMLVLLGGVWVFRKSSWAWRALLPFALVPVTYIYLLSQRRAAFVALVAALGMLGIFLLWTNRRVFLKIAPVVLIIGTIYTAAFWHDETTTAGFPAQAIKSVIAPDDVSERNQGSDLYRIIEKQDIRATIDSSPIVGIGFGHAFLRPYPLPFINPFLLEPYMPHNSILWVWMKAGIGGFVAMLYLFGTAMHTGAREVLRAGRGNHAATLLTSVAFVLMYAVFAYVDIAWDPQNMILLGIAMAQIANAARLDPGRPVEARDTSPGIELVKAVSSAR
jgi:O-Antigen ligase